uniref:Uncharacterized protein n=1 Tax=Cannabis sativa TaxID=3483 RepID=A0A803PXD5_CANSA
MIVTVRCCFGQTIGQQKKTRSDVVFWALLLLVLWAWSGPGPPHSVRADLDLFFLGLGVVIWCRFGGGGGKKGMETTLLDGCEWE